MRRCHARRYHDLRAYDDTEVVPEPIEASAEDAADGLKMQFRLPIAFERFPPGAVEQKQTGFRGVLSEVVD